MPRTLTDLLFRPTCAACDAPLAARAPFCPRCAESLYPIERACPGCASPVAGPIDVTCRRCRKRRLPLETIRSPYRFGGELAVALRRLKYGERPDLARQLAPLYARELLTALGGCDLAIPIPMHWRRRTRRGYNQAQLLLRWATGFGLRRHVAPAALRRIRATAPQAGLSGRERRANLSGAFAVPRRARRRITGARVLLVDDVVTTGTTMAAAARALRQAGAAAVVGFAVARAD